MALDCPCSVTDTWGLNPTNYKYVCVKNGQYREFVVQSGNPLAAKDKVCDLYEDNWELGLPVPPPKKGGSGGACLPLDTPVKLARGGTRPIGELAPGDEILCCASDRTELISRPIYGISYGYGADLVKLTNSADDWIVTSRDQPIITVSGPVKAEYVFLGATTFRLDEEGRQVRRDGHNLARRELLLERADVASLDLKGDYYYFAGRFSWWVLTCHSGGGVGPVKKK